MTRIGFAALATLGAIALLVVVGPLLWTIPPEATSPALTRDYHVRAEHVASAVAEMLGKPIDVGALIAQRTYPHDVPGDWFAGPF